MIDKLLNSILPPLSRQVAIKQKLRGCTVNKDNSLTAPSRASYDGNLINLLLLTASTAVCEPVWDIFNCMKIKIVSLSLVDKENELQTDDKW